MASGGRLTRKIGIVAVGRAANALSVYAVYVLVARAWPSAECGLFLAVWVLGNALIPVFLMGLPTSLLYFLPRRENARPLVAQAFACLLVSALLLVGILFLWGPQLSAWLQQGTPHGEVITSYLQFFLPYVFALVTGGFAESVLIVANRENWLAWLQLVMGTGLLTGGFAALYLGLGPDGVLALFSCLAIIRLLAASYLVRRALGAGKGWLTLAGFTELMCYTRPIGLNDAVGSLSRYVDRFVVLYYFAAGATFAEYTLGAFEVPISLLLAGVVSVLVPEISRLFQAGELGEIHALWQRAVVRLALLVLPLAAFLLVFAEPMIAWMYPQYDRSVWVFRLYLLVLPLRCAIYNPLLVGMGKARWALWGSLGDLLCNIGLSVALIGILQKSAPEWAFVGPAIATVSSTYLQVLFLLAAIGWHLRWSLAKLLPWANLLRIGVRAGGAAVASRWATASMGGEVSQLLLGGLCYVVLLGLLLWSNPADRGALSQVVRALTRWDR